MNVSQISRVEIKDQLKTVAGYYANDEVALAIKNAQILGKPILVEGPPGVGKTELAKAVGKLMETDMIRLQCSPEMSERKALYEFNYTKQLLFIQMLKDQMHVDRNENILQMIERIDADNPFYSEHFLLKRPILQAFCPEDGKQKVLLIDELDKADEEFEYGLLEAFSDYSISIPEIGTIEATVKPITIVTSNRARRLTDTFLRRCIYLYIDYPSVKEETDILTTKTNANPHLAKQIAGLMKKLREHNLKQKPSIAESIEWATILSIHFENDEASVEAMKETISIIAKQPSDREKIVDMVAG